MTSPLYQRLGAGFWRVSTLLVIALVLAGLASQVLPAIARVRDPFKGWAIAQPAFPSFTYSIHVFGWWDSGFFGYQLDSVRLLRFNTVKHTFAWKDLEPKRGEWNFSESDRILRETEARGLKVVARLGETPSWATADGSEGSDVVDTPPASLDDWATYCETLAGRYRGRIIAYQVWNEPNLTREWGGQPPDAVAYVALLARCSTAIRRADPNAKIISAGLSPTGTYEGAIAHPDDVYLDAMYRAGFQQYVDAVGVHAPGFSPPSYGPDDAEREGRGRWFAFRRPEDLRKIMLKYGDEARQMAILEMGYTTDPIHPDYAWYAVTEEERARYMVEAFDYMRDHWRPWVGLVSVIYMQKPGWTRADEQYWWSISTLDRFHTPAFMALAQMAKYCDGVVLPAWKPNATEEEYLADLNACP